MLVEPVPKTGNSPLQPADVRVPQEAQVAHTAKRTKSDGQSPDLAQVKEIAADLQQNIRVLNNVDLQFSVHKSSGRIMVTVTDEDTGKVVREIPERELLNLAARLEEMMGLIFNEKV